MRAVDSVNFGLRSWLVILSEAKDHLATIDPRKKILRFAQDDKSTNRPIFDPPPLIFL